MDASQLMGALRGNMRRPRDLRDVLRNYGKWREMFGESLGVIPIIIGLKFPVAREAFYTAFADACDDTGMAQKVFTALRAAALKFHDASARSQLRHEVDAIKGPSLCHGFAVYLTKLNVVKQCRRDHPAAISLGATTRCYCVNNAKHAFVSPDECVSV